MSSEATNLIRWRESGEAHRWVWGRSGNWSHADWVALLATLQTSPFWPMTEEEIQKSLKELSQSYLDLQRCKLLGDESASHQLKLNAIESDTRISELTVKIKNLEEDLKDKDDEMQFQREGYSSIIQWHKDKIEELVRKQKELQSKP